MLGWWTLEASLELIPSPAVRLCLASTEGGLWLKLSDRASEFRAAGADGFQRGP